MNHRPEVVIPISPLDEEEERRHVGGEELEPGNGESGEDTVEDRMGEWIEEAKDYSQAIYSDNERDRRTYAVALALQTMVPTLCGRPRGWIAASDGEG